MSGKVQIVDDYIYKCPWDNKAVDGYVEITLFCVVIWREEFLLRL